MKLPVPPHASAVARHPLVHALTLVELMITMGIFSLVVAAFITLHIFGLRQNQLVESKLGASDQARRMFGELTKEIRSARMWSIGNLSGSTFVAVPLGSVQQGRALQLHLTADTNNWIRYYFVPSAGTLMRTRSGGTGAETLLVDLTNNMAFRAENYMGQVQTNRSWRNVIRVIVEFAQYQYPLTQVGPDNYYDYYKLEFKATPHCPNLP